VEIWEKLTALPAALWDTRGVVAMPLVIFSARVQVEYYNVTKMPLPTLSGMGAQIEQVSLTSMFSTALAATGTQVESEEIQECP
jgi:hypothetical protein